MSDQTPLTIETLRAFLKENLRIDVAFTVREFSNSECAEAVIEVKVCLGEDEVAVGQDCIILRADVLS